MPAPARAPPGDPDGSPPNGEQALYQAISRWRERLARDSARNNLALRSTEIAAAVNRIVFLLLFTSIAEDRGLVAPGTLDKIARAGDPLAGLAAVFGGADPWAGAGEPAGGTAARADPAIGASVLQALFAEASEPGFRPGLLPAGSVSAAVARYLGSTIRRSAAHQAIVVAGDRAPGSRGPAAGAVAEYLAETTLSAAAHRRSRRELLPLRVIDPACGAGGVLVPAYRRLVAMRAGASPSFAERAEILLDSVHGADPDPHAVAATRLALLIAAFGGDSAAALPPGDFPGTARDILTGLSRTIVRGDLTVGPEIVHEEGWMFATPRDRHAIRPLVWREAFPEIAAAGGFDAAVGDLPEGVVGQKEWLQQYFQRHYEVYDPDAERSAYYLERSCGIVRHGGVIGFCTGDGWLRKTAGLPLRTFLMRKEICRLADITAKPGDPASGTCVLVIVNRTPRVRVNFPAAIVPLPPAGSARDLAALVAREEFPLTRHA